MMAVEGPFLAAIIARLANPKLNLAAHGVAFAIALLVESPIIMLMSAGTALVVDRRSYLTLRNFAFALNAMVAAVMLVVVLPGVYDVLERMLGLPPEVAWRVRGAMALYIPWPAAIGYRRLYQGMLIRAGLTNRVAYGTALRLGTIVLTGFLLHRFSHLEGASIGAASLSTAVVVEAIACRVMAVSVVRQMMNRTEHDPQREPLTTRAVLAFYYPLAMTSVLTMGIQPVVTFFMARARFPIESLAVLPVVNSIVFLFQTFGLACQEVVIAVLSDRKQDRTVVERFVTLLALLASAGLAAVVVTPFAGVWFQTISGLTPMLSGFAGPAARILVFMPGVTVLMAFQRALLVDAKSTGPITWATIIEVVGVVVVMLVGTAGMSMTGIIAAATALFVGRLAGMLYLARPAKQRWAECLPRA